MQLFSKAYEMALWNGVSNDNGHYILLLECTEHVCMRATEDTCKKIGEVKIKFSGSAVGDFGQKSH
jgi:hypothetical protein